MSVEDLCKSSMSDFIHECWVALVPYNCVYFDVFHRMMMRYMQLLNICVRLGKSLEMN